jgi:hypothetical protein
MPDNKSQDAIALLKADHRTVEDLFTQFSKRRRQETEARVADLR